MDVVIRAVNQRFLDDVAFPFLRLGTADRATALTKLLEQVDDAQTSAPAEALLEGGDPERFGDLVYRLLFAEWRRTPHGWVVAEEQAAFAGGLDPTLHTALMLTDPTYPYWDEAAAQAERARVIAPPYLDRGLPAFLGGLWDPCPADFDPGDILSTRGVHLYRPAERLALADWSWRPPAVVAGWSRDLPRALRSLMEREVARLRPIEIPEVGEVLDYWLGVASKPPPLVVCFSGLGADAALWVRDVAALADQLRRAATRDQGLTCIVTGGPRGIY